MIKLSVNIADLKKINEIVKENDIKQGFNLIQDNECGIGYTLDMEWEAKLNGRKVIVKTSIVDESEW